MMSEPIHPPMPTTDARAETPEDLGEVVRAVHRDRGGHGRVDALEARLVSRVVLRQRHHRREVPAGRPAGDDDPRRVAAVLRDVRTDPRERQLGVDEVVGPPTAGAEPVVRGDAHPAGSRQPVHERSALCVLRADRPPTAVDLEQTGAPVVERPRAVHVEEVTAARAVGVPDVLDALDAAVAHQARAAPSNGASVRVVDRCATRCGEHAIELRRAGAGLPRLAEEHRHRRRRPARGRANPATPTSAPSAISATVPTTAITSHHPAIPVPSHDTTNAGKSSAQWCTAYTAGTVISASSTPAASSTQGMSHIEADAPAAGSGPPGGSTSPRPRRSSVGLSRGTASPRRSPVGPPDG